MYALHHHESSSFTTSCALRRALLIDSLLIARDICISPLGSWIPKALCSFWTFSNVRTNSFRTALLIVLLSPCRKELSSSGEYHDAFWEALGDSTTNVLGSHSSKLTLLPVFLSPDEEELLFLIAAELARDRRAMFQT